MNQTLKYPDQPTKSQWPSTLPPPYLIAKYVTIGPGISATNSMYVLFANILITESLVAPNANLLPHATTHPRSTLPGLTILSPSPRQWPHAIHLDSRQCPVLATVHPCSLNSSLQLPIRSALTSKFIFLHTQLQRTSGPNTSTLCQPIPSKLNIPEWRSRLHDYPDWDLCDFLNFRWPISHSSTHSSPASSQTNHGYTLANPQNTAAFLSRKCELGATCGPFPSNPLTLQLVTSLLQIAYSRSGKPHMVVDLSFSSGQSVNSRTPSDIYLGVPFSLCLPGIKALLVIVPLKGPGCHIFKDLSHVYCQIRIDLQDYHLLGFCHDGSLYFDVTPPFRLCSMAMTCQPTVKCTKPLGTIFIPDYHEPTSTPYACSTYTMVSKWSTWQLWGLSNKERPQAHSEYHVTPQAPYHTQDPHPVKIVPGHSTFNIYGRFPFLPTEL